jgi:hypothetical protein
MVTTATKKPCPMHRRVLILLCWKLIRFHRGEDTPYISMHELVGRLERLTGVAYRSIYMSLTGNGTDRVTNPDHGVQKSWAYCRHPDRPGEAGFIVRDSEEFKSGRFLENKPDYKSPEKCVSRSRGFKAFLESHPSTPRILTLGAEEGFCVKELLQSCPDATIVSLECKAVVRRKFKVNFAGYPNVMSKAGELEVFVQRDRLRFDFLNLDAMGYMCDAKDQMLATINAKSSASYVTLTLECQKRLRNCGVYVDRIRAACRERGVRDEVRYAVEVAAPDFCIVDDFSYGGHRRKMRVFVLARQDNHSIQGD